MTVPGTKLSQIALAGSPPALSDTLVGVSGGTTDNQFTLAQVQTAIGGRQALTGDTIFYVRTTGNDTTGDGSAGNPWLTIVHTIAILASEFDFQGHAAFIDIGAGTFEGAGIPGILPMTGGGSLVIRGAGSGSTTITATGGADTFDINTALGVTLYLNKFTLTCDASAFALVTCFSAGNAVFFGDGPPGAPNTPDIIFIPSGNVNAALVFAAPSAFFFGPGGQYVVDGSLAAGTPIFFMECSFNGAVQLNSDVWNFINNPVFSAFFAPDFGGDITEFAPTYMGSASGTTWEVATGAAGQGGGAIPGTALGGPIVNGTFGNGDGTEGTAGFDKIVAIGTVTIKDHLVADLPTAGVKGRRSTVSDATQTLTAGIGAIVAGTGGNTVPVFDDGTNWRIG